jgi:hypothetical protein
MHGVTGSLKLNEIDLDSCIQAQAGGVLTCIRPDSVYAPAKQNDAKHLA